jgi:hypothetical protein
VKAWERNVLNANRQRRFSGLGSHEEEEVEEEEEEEEEEG